MNANLEIMYAKLIQMDGLNVLQKARNSMHVRVLGGLEREGRLAAWSPCQNFQVPISLKLCGTFGNDCFGKGMEMCKNKVWVIEEWPTPKTTKRVEAFSEFANFYCRFIYDFSRTAVPLTALTEKNQRFECTLLPSEALEEFQFYVIKAPMLLYPNLNNLLWWK